VAPHTITVDTGFGANVLLHDYAGHAADARTDGQGRVTLTLPKNEGGFGYVCYSRAGIGGGFNPLAQGVTQDYEGAPDLDILPADNSQFVTVCRLWVAQGKTIRTSLHYDTTAWSEQTTILLELTDPNGARIGSQTFSRSTGQPGSLQATAPATGWHTFRIRSANTPATNLKPTYRLTVSYHAPQEGIGV
jgi:alpha-amylase